ARWPVAAPISSTFSWRCTLSSCSSRASTLGASMRRVAVSGSSVSTKACALWASGTKSSRWTTRSSSSTAGASTSHGRICCSIMLKRACSTFILFSGARYGLKTKILGARRGRQQAVQQQRHLRVQQLLGAHGLVADVVLAEGVLVQQHVQHRRDQHVHGR